MVYSETKNSELLVDQLKKENIELKQRVFTVANKSWEVMFYTGLPSYAVYVHLFLFLYPLYHHHNS